MSVSQCRRLVLEVRPPQRLLQDDGVFGDVDPQRAGSIGVPLQREVDFRTGMHSRHRPVVARGVVRGVRSVAAAAQLAIRDEPAVTPRCIRTRDAGPVHQGFGPAHEHRVRARSVAGFPAAHTGIEEAGVGAGSKPDEAAARLGTRRAGRGERHDDERPDHEQAGGEQRY